MTFAKQHATIFLLSTLLLFSGLTCKENREQGTHKKGFRLQDVGQAANIYIWKDREGVTHIGDVPPTDYPVKTMKAEKPTVIPTNSENSENSATGGTTEQTEFMKLSAVTKKQPPAPAQQGKPSTEQALLQEQHLVLEHLFVHARNKGDGYAQIRLRHLLDANSREQKRVRSENKNPSATSDHSSKVGQP